ncbi:MAG: MurR/RpiR family transcriptional regulator [Eubacteriales bacterium]|nr:MurR/RpiR family transcriptional regulator [Eubacteriales bacterium]
MDKKCRYQFEEDGSDCSDIEGLDESEERFEVGSSNIYELIERRYYNLTRSEKRLAAYIEKSREAIQYMSISELAQRVRVADATVTRFCRKLGLTGFNAFKLAIAQANADPSRFEVAALELKLAEASTGDSGVDEAGQAFHELLENIARQNYDAMIETLGLADADTYRQAAKALYDAKHIYCMGLGGSLVMAREAYSLFSTVMSKISVVEDAHMQVYMTANLDPQDVILYFSYSGATRSLMKVAKLAASRDLQLLLISRYRYSPASQYAQLTLQCGSNESVLRSGSVQARMAQMTVLEILYEVYLSLDLKSSAEARSSAMEALSEELL